MDYARFVEIVAEETMADPEWIKPDSLLEGELGMQSIDVVQIVERVEIELGRPRDNLDFEGVETVEEFFWELIGGGFDGEDSVVAAMADTASKAAQAPHEVALRKFMPNDPLADVTTLLGMLGRRAAVTPDREAFRFESEKVTYRQLSRRIAKMARALRDQGVGEGDRVLIVMPNSAEFFYVFYGIQHLRAVAVPVFHASRPVRIAAIAAQAEAAAIVMLRPPSKRMRDKVVEALGGLDVTLLDAPSLKTSMVNMARALPSPLPTDLAMLQFTSGTTGHSKGVMLTHQALLANVRQAIPPGRFSRDEVFVSWLPVYHDMGLIIMTMIPAYLGARLVLLPVSLKPHAWLRAMSEEGGTLTAAPDFAYRYALRFAGDADQYDLSKLRIALVAAEPVRARTVARFESAFGIPGVLKPAYGLAECSVSVTFPPPDRKDIVVDDDGVVGVGRALVGTDMDIRDEEGRSVARGTHGELCLRSPSQTIGYYGDEETTANLFTDDGFVRTGDIGYMNDEGELFIVGRSKNVIIVAGRNISPKELEEIAEGVEGIRTAMALGIDKGGDAGEQVYLFVEPAAPTVPDDAEVLRLRREVRQQIQSQLGLRPDFVEMVPPRNIPRTYNGKLQYGKMRERVKAAAATE